ncbi:EAL domain-containing protein [Aliivibrio salmonicida]|jgi:EAL domain-containing protein (putative c-di-GMP-specific phosphodiesterase class I)/GGDEF domain-containing protein|uniref:Signaling protein n=1 Tax=Aliivibrio salmonicida (strain LFI1238) TaxID=316275 RepID=B6EQS0_ALISL|nr:EAL domain-containing protein [Aliivibrio salmonicida]AZL86464.1 EAL domain-containing protein [Aliivibrio salmonicida]CAQ81048.1 putative signaling protein [Aliivibrio salmonicida LFI1238]
MTTSLSASIAIPERMQKEWQNMLNLLANLVHVPAALIMQTHENTIEVFAASDNTDNPYKVGHHEALGQGLYCEKIIKERQQLFIANALTDPNWDTNPDIALNMIAYCGLPLYWPDNTPFGTICILDNKENDYSPTYQALLKTYQQSIEAQLSTLFQHAELLISHNALQQEITIATQHLNDLNIQLANEVDCRRAAEQKVEYHQNHDLGTGFLNQIALYQHMDNLLKQEKNFVLLHIHFANGLLIQQTHGHQALDRLLTEYRSRITKITDTSITGRLTATDILLVIHADKSKLPKFCQHLSEIGQSNYYINDKSIHLQSYVGAIHSKDGVPRTDLLQYAHDTMVECQSMGKTFTISDVSLPIKSSLSEHQIESYLLEAVRNNDLFLNYQPKVCPITKKWLGCEALLRWNHPRLGAISNDVLIQIAERNGLIYELGNFALRNAIQQTSEWVAHCPAFITAVNVSAVQLKDPYLVEHIEQLLNVYQLSPRNLELEVTESSLIADEDLAITTLNRLHDLGVSIALDDFGTGYASFQYLKKYPFDTLKIDKSFITNITYSTEDQNIVCAMINIAKKLHLNVVVEGIETREQEQFILKEEADLVQGYLYAKPMTAEKFEMGLFNQLSLGTPYFKFI